MNVFALRDRLQAAIDSGHGDCEVIMSVPGDEIPARDTEIIDGEFVIED